MSYSKNLYLQRSKHSAFCMLLDYEGKRESSVEIRLPGLNIKYKKPKKKKKRKEFKNQAREVVTEVFGYYFYQKKNVQRRGQFCYLSQEGTTFIIVHKTLKCLI